MKTHKTTALILLLFLLMQVTTNLHTQVRLGGNIAPNPSAILDLNANDTALGTRGLLLPRVALVATTDASPMTMHIPGMLVFNTATSNDVSPGVYYNDGEMWVRGIEGAVPAEPTTSTVREVSIDINEAISLQSMRYHGEITDLDPSATILGIRGEFSDPTVVHTSFTVTTLLSATDLGRVTWSLHIQNFNFDPQISSTLERVVIIYDSPHKETPKISHLGSFAFVGW